MQHLLFSTVIHTQVNLTPNGKSLVHLSLLTSCLFLRQTRNHSSNLNRGSPGLQAQTPTLGLPARLVTSRMSFTVPWALQISSSSSLVQEKGRPDTNSLCFSRAVLYLNTCGGGRGLTPWAQPSSPHRRVRPHPQAGPDLALGAKNCSLALGQVPHFSMPSFPPLENGQNEGRHSPSLGEGQKVTHQTLGAAPSLLTIPRQGAVTRAYCYRQLSTPAAQ